MDQIDKSIEEARTIVADLTGRNPNVMQEVGYARALKKPIVFITQDPHRELPFDTRHYRTQRYDGTPEGLGALRAWLARSIAEVLREPDTGMPEAPPLTLPQDYVQREIHPQIEAKGYELVYPLIERADEFRLRGWEEVRWRDSKGKLRPVRTEEHSVFMRRRTENL